LNTAHRHAKLKAYPTILVNLQVIFGLWSLTYGCQTSRKNVQFY